MTFDDAGNLLLADSGSGQVLRFPYADGVLGEAEVLTSGMDEPGNVALFTDGDQAYLYVSEPEQITRFAYDPAGPVGEQEAIVSGLPTSGTRHADGPFWSRWHDVPGGRLLVQHLRRRRSDPGDRIAFDTTGWQPGDYRNRLAQSGRPRLAA